MWLVHPLVQVNAIAIPVEKAYALMAQADALIVGSPWCILVALPPS